GIDVVGQSRALDGTLLGEFEDEIRTVGEEQVELVAARAGLYGVTIKASPGSVQPGRYSVRVVDRHPSTDIDRALQNARTLRAQAARLDLEGRFDAACSALEDALVLTESARGTDDVQTAIVAGELASVYRKVPNDARSEALFERSLAVLDRRLGPADAMTAVVRSRLGQLYQKTGQPAKAEATLRQSLDAIEAALGTDNRWFAT